MLSITVATEAWVFCCDFTVSTVDGLIALRRGGEESKFCDLCFANNWGKRRQQPKYANRPTKNCPFFLSRVCAMPLVMSLRKLTLPANTEQQ